MQEWHFGEGLIVLQLRVHHVTAATVPCGRGYGKGPRYDTPGRLSCYLA